MTALLSTQTAAAAEGPGDGPGTPGAVDRITAVKKVDARIQDLTVLSSAMGASIPVRVILPKGWDKASGVTYPVLYMLHGGEDDYTSWTRETDVEELAKDANVIVVMPDGGKAGYYSDWYAGTPRWETFHTTELVRLMEQEYHAGPARAIVGLSMGGFGALNYAGRHPGMFRYAAAMSSYVDLNDPVVRLTLALGTGLAGIDVKQVWGDPVANAAVWQAHNPAAMPGAFRGTRVHLSAGNGLPGPLDQGRPLDVLLVGAVAESALPESIRKFSTALRSRGVAVTTHLYGPGTHSWPYWQRELHSIWPTIMTSLR
ncbi:alpha/beta hydrolase [Streptomyces sp. NPDC002580]|uniref:alpha/beta hydrolase n=1 Tax=Streptomyces sp. NPDC002580 TaxID=3364653 RepID=UPI00369803E3